MQARIQTRIDANIKEQAEVILKQYRYTSSKLISIIYAYIVQTNSLPIEITKIPNSLRQKAQRPLLKRRPYSFTRITYFTRLASYLSNQ